MTATALGHADATAGNIAGTGADATALLAHTVRSVAMSPDTRRRVMLAVVALIVIAFVLSTAACTNSTDQDGEGVDAAAPLDASFYTGEMSDICEASDEAIAALPARPAAISDADWADEISEIFATEANEFISLMVADDLSETHGALAQTTEELAVAWADLSTALDAVDDAALSEATTVVGELTLGRNDLAVELGVDRCAERTGLS